MSVVGEILTVIGTVIKAGLIIYGAVLVLSIIGGIIIRTWEIIEYLESSRPSPPKSTSPSLVSTPAPTLVPSLSPEEEIHQIALDTQEKIRQRSAEFRREIYDYIEANA